MSDITKLRENKGTTEKVFEAGNNVAKALNVQVENYPTLKTSEAIQKLMGATEEIELEISAARRLYNSYVNQFNTGIFTWPGSITASAMHLTKLQLFAASEDDRKDVEIKF